MNIRIIAMSLLLLPAMPDSAQTQNDGPVQARTECSVSNGKGKKAGDKLRYGKKRQGFRPGGKRRAVTYFVNGNDVYYDGKKIDGAAGSSFKTLGGSYGKDDFGVYFRGEKIDGANASSFKLLGRRYAKDDFGVYRNGKKIDGANASSFTVLGKGYAKDDFNVYYGDKRVSGANASSFRVMSDGYAKDDFNVYYKGQRSE